MRSPSPLIAAAPLAALLALSACDRGADRDAAANAQANATANATAVAPPPMIQASKTYRCKDNSLLYAEFYTDNSVKVRAEKDGPATTLTAEGGNPPYTAEGYSLSANAPEVTYSAPGKGSQSCHV